MSDTNLKYVSQDGLEAIRDWGNLNFQRKVNLPTILTGTDAPTASDGNDGNLYFQTTGNKEWTCDSEYFVNSTSQLLATQSAAFYKINDGPAIGVHYKRGSYYGPLLISTIADNVYYTNNTSNCYSADIDGVTWYLSTSTYWNTGTDSPSIPTLYDLGLSIDSTNAEAIIRAILTASNMAYTEANYIITNTYVKVNGAWTPLIGAGKDDPTTSMLIDKTLTANGTYSASDDSADGYSSVTVNVSGGESDDSFTLTDYIETSDKAYIDTGYLVNSNTTRIECVANVSSSQSVDYCTLFGARPSNTPSLCCSIFTRNSGSYPLRRTWATSDYTEFLASSEVSTWEGLKTKYIHEPGYSAIKTEDGYISGRTFSSDGTLSMSNSLYLFTLNEANSAQSKSYCNAKVYRFRIYEGDTLVLNLLPAEANGTACMHDTVSDTYFYNANSSGSFTFGTDS